MEKGLGVIDAISRWSGRIVAISQPALVIIMMWEVIARYIFNRPSVWAFELALFVWGGSHILAGGFCSLEKAHIRIDVLSARLPPRWRAALDIVTSSLMFLFIMALLWYGWGWAMRSITPPIERNDTMWAPVVWPLRFAVVIGATMLILQGIAGLMRNVRFLVTRKEVTGG